MDRRFEKDTRRWWWRLSALAIGGIVVGAGREFGVWAFDHWIWWWLQ